MRLEMLQVARQSPRSLSEAADLVRTFVRGQLHQCGGFSDRAGNPDLYYTVFGLGCMMALDEPVPVDQVALWLDHFGSGEGLDLVHLSALARCWSGIGRPGPGVAMLPRIEAYRARSGGYNVSEGAEYGNPYGNFMALGAYQDLGMEVPLPQELVEGCLQCVSADGGFSNDPGLPVGNVPALAAAESVLRNLGAETPERACAWLQAQFYTEGGFFAVPAAPMPDLLSTATALHALAGMGVEYGEMKEPCLDYIDSLWINQGGFYGNWGDVNLDCEYTFYGLLALGHLSL